jgi:hypothetical protein
MFSRTKHVVSVKRKSSAQSYRELSSAGINRAKMEPQSVFDVAGDQPDLEDMIAWTINRS